MRRSTGLITLSLAALLVAMVPASVSAKAPIRIQDRSTSLDCFVETADGFLVLSVTDSTAFGDFVDLAFWEAPLSPEEDAPSYVVTDAVVDAGPASLQAVIQVAEFEPESDPPFGAPLAPVIVDVDVEAIGDPIEFDQPFREGNRRGRESGTIQFLQPSGSVTLPGADLTDLSGCGALSVDGTFFGTNPAGFNIRFADHSVSCTWETETTFVNLFVTRDELGGFGDVFLFDGERELGGSGDATLTETGLTLPELPLFDFIDGAEVGSASASATLTETGETVRIVEASGRDRTKIVATLFDVEGTFEVTIDGTTAAYPMDAEHCQAQDARIRVHEVRPAGPPAKRITNDTPETAAPLRLGRSVRLTTGLGAPAAEAPCVLEDGFEVPIGHTAWWSVVGNGRELTADSAGSIFDTVLGVYVRQGSALVQVACIDDVFTETTSSLQAAASWDSVAGVTYLIQVGGFDGQTGQLRLVVR